MIMRKWKQMNRVNHSSLITIVTRMIIKLEYSIRRRVAIVVAWIRLWSSTNINASTRIKLSKIQCNSIPSIIKSTITITLITVRPRRELWETTSQCKHLSTRLFHKQPESRTMADTIKSTLTITYKSFLKMNVPHWSRLVASIMLTKTIQRSLLYKHRKFWLVRKEM